MRRLLTLLAPTVLLLMSLGIGLFTADLPFWRRAIDLPLAANESYIPTTRIEAAPAPGFADVERGAITVDAAALDSVTARARAAGADALLVMHEGALQLAYVRARVRAGDARAPLPADFLARPLVAMAVGVARAEGSIESLDVPVSRWLPEWEGEPRGAITLRQLLNETSGLETGVDAAELLGSRPFADLTGLARFGTSRGVRLLLGNDFESTALGFELDHEPGGFFNVSPANSQLAAVIVERATGVDFERLLVEKNLARGTLELQMDRRSGMPAMHCCLRIDPHGALALAELVRTGGVGLLPPGWTDEMAKGSRSNPQFGLQLQRLEGAVPDVWHLGSGKGGGAWIVPRAALTVVVLARRDTPTPLAIVEPLLASSAGLSK